MNKSKKMYIFMLAVVGILLITFGISYSLFSYKKNGSTESKITPDYITFLYDEMQGNGVSLTDALPVSDNEGKAGEPFEFQIVSHPISTTPMIYEITLSKTEDSGNLDSIIKVYLTKVDSQGNETQVSLSKYSELTTVIHHGEQEKLIHTQDFNTNHTQKYRLRMWVSEDADFSNPQNVGKTFSIKVNAYASDLSTITATDLAYNNRNHPNITNVQQALDDIYYKFK